MIICNNCYKDIGTTDIYDTVNLGSAKNKTWQSIGIVCPHCEYRYHSFYTNDVMERRKAKLKTLSGVELQEAKAKIAEYQRQANEQGKRLFNEHKTPSS